MADTIEYDLVVIGGGPAGYAGAIRAGQLGKTVACVEMDRPGGTCLNWGCIPSKALLKSAELYQKMLHAADFGLSAESVGFNFEQVVSRSRKVAEQMAGGIEFLFRKNKVDHFRGQGQVTGPGMVEVKDGPDKGKLIKAKNILDLYLDKIFRLNIGSLMMKEMSELGAESIYLDVIDKNREKINKSIQKCINIFKVG